jgi:putative glycosyltransferase (TIGR04348 family)
MIASPDAVPRVHIVTPALAGANNGNAHTAARWQGFLAPVAACEMALQWRGEPADLLIALHARLSAGSIAAFHAAHPELPIAVVLTGTDLYRDIEDDASAQHSLECASALVVLQDEGPARLDAAARAKARVIVQSAPSLLQPPRPAAQAEFVAVGHLREEKDPLTLMAAARLAGPSVRIAHIGAALDATLGAAAAQTMQACPGYRWLGAMEHGATRRRIARALALIHPSRLEGGANVVVEALRSRVPVLASRIDGNLGLLGADYDGTFEVGDAAGLARLMRRFVDDSAFAAHLAAQCAARAPRFRPALERAAVRHLVADLLEPRRRGAETIAAPQATRSP